MSDIIARTEAALAAPWDARSDTQVASLMPELVAEAKRLREAVRQLETTGYMDYSGSTAHYQQALDAEL